MVGMNHGGFEREIASLVVALVSVRHLCYHTSLTTVRCVCFDMPRVVSLARAYLPFDPQRGTTLAERTRKVSVKRVKARRLQVRRPPGRCSWRRRALPRAILIVVLVQGRRWRCQSLSFRTTERRTIAVATAAADAITSSSRDVADPDGDGGKEHRRGHRR